MSGHGDGFCLGEWLVEPALNRVSKGNRVVRLEPRTMEVLRCLAERAGEVVSRQEIVDAVWRQEFVGGAAVSAAVVKLRGALGDDARQPSFIETVSKRGYRLVARVQRLDRPAGDDLVAEVAYPPFLAGGDRPGPPGRVFVGRQQELARLEGAMDAAVAGEGRVAFVTGEAGTGKTSLVEELARRSMERHGELAAVSAVASAFTGLGDPYAPFRQVLAQLSGDVEPRLASGALSREQARRLWQLIPATCRAITEAGPDLLDTLVSGAGLLARASAAVLDGESWLTGLRDLVARRASQPPDLTLQQAAVFAELSGVLREISRRRPLLVVVDDLHWADAGSLAMLAHLGREVAGSRVLIVGTLRPEEVALGRGRERHPLQQVVHELTRTFGEAEVTLGQTGSREFVDAYLDSEPNRLDDAFREDLHARTQGHALFTVELLRSLQEQGMIVRGDDGRWEEGEALDWQRLPARVEGVIGERIDRLSGRLRNLLSVASVEGTDFTVEVLARLRGEPAGEIVRLLSEELDRRHRLVQARGLREVAAGRLSLFAFSHVLFQHYLYGTLNEVERAHLHGQIGDLLEALYGDRAEEIAPQLAWHFEEAGVVDRAVHHLQRAGLSCARRTGHEEAIRHLRRALDLVGSQAESPDRDRTELHLQLGIMPSLFATRGFGSVEAGAAAERALALADRIQDGPLLLPVLFHGSVFFSCRADYRRGLELGERMLELARSRGDAVNEAMARWAVGYACYFTGSLSAGGEHLRCSLELYDPDQHPAARHLYAGVDAAVAVRMHLSWVLAFEGYPESSRRLVDEAEGLAERLDHPMSLGFLSLMALTCSLVWGALDETERHVDLLRTIAIRHAFPLYGAWAEVFHVYLALLRGHPTTDDPVIQRHIETLNVVMPCFKSLALTQSAVEHHHHGLTGRALEIFDEARRFVESHDERVLEAFLHLQWGRVLRDTGSEVDAEAHLTTTLDVARRQRAKLWELEAATELARLWLGRGKVTEARELLQPVHDWFTEGLGTPPLVAAKALLEELRAS